MGSSGSSGSYQQPVSTDYCPPQDCPCSCSCSASPGLSAKPVRYFNGELRLTVDDLPASGYGMAWGHQRTYSNRLSVNTNFRNGFNWLVDQWSHVVDLGDGSVEVLFNPLLAYWFDRVDGEYVARFGAKQTLTQVGDNLVLSFPDGEVFTYLGLDDTVAPGMLSGVTSLGGINLSLSFNGDGSVASATRTDGTTVEQFLYEYYSLPNIRAGWLQQVTLVRDGASVSRAAYDYWVGDISFGSFGDLSNVETFNFNADTATWISTGTTQYRYWTADEAPGFEHGLKYVLLPANYQLMVAAGLDPNSVDDSVLAEYADYYFEYNNPTERRVSLETVDGGSETYHFDFTPSSFPLAYNNWFQQTLETQPDGSQYTVFTNNIGQVVLKQLSDIGGNRWIEYYKYDDDAHEIYYYLPSAIDMSATLVYDPTVANLNVQTNASSGLVYAKTYYATNDPITGGGTGTGSGAAAGYVQFEQVQNGSGATPITLKWLQYTSNTVGLATVYPVAKTTIYRDDAGTQPVVTAMAYTWPSGSNQPSQIITTFPSVSAAQNGPGYSAVETDLFDIFGNRVWQQDVRGFINYWAFDTSLGVVTQQIQDFNTGVSHPGITPPSGWTTPSGGGLDLTSDFAFDIQGRPAQSLGPVHTVDLSGTATAIRTATWTVYRDDLDQVWSAAGYQTTASTPVATLVNPVSIIQHDDGGRTVQQIAAARASTSGPLSPTDSFEQTTYVRWSTTTYNAQNEVAAKAKYFLIPDMGPGMPGSNYNETTFGYDSMGRGNMNKTPTGTITRTVHDARDNVLSTWVGTNDTGATDTDPSNGGVAPNNMLLVTQNQYDGGAQGLDGNLTTVTDCVDADSANDRITTMGYDWRNRQTSAAGAENYCLVKQYDTLDRVVQTNRTDTTPSGAILTQETTAFDDMGRTFQAATYQVISGTASLPQIGNTWFDLAGNTIKSKPAGSSAWSKMTYDGAGRTSGTYSGYSTATEDWNEAGTINTSIVFEQSIPTYDAASNVIATASYQRDFNAPTSGTGSMGVLNGIWTSTSPTARVTFVANYPDGIGRTVNTANYGTNGNTAFTRPVTCPASSASILVSNVAYNDRGEAFQTVDPMGTVNQQTWDQAGRSTQTVQNYVSGGTASDQNMTVNKTYNPDSNVATLTAVNATTGNQTTSYNYGITVAGGSKLNSNSALHSVSYPDGGTVLSEFNRQGDVIQSTDQNGTVRQFGFDGLGRPTADAVTTAASGVDTAILRIERAYEIRGMVENITSYNAATGGSVVNDVQKVYNGFRQLVTEYQEHGGPVVIGVSPNIQYSFADGSANTIRPTGVVYPNGNALAYAYGTSGSLNDLLSRIQSLVSNGTDVTDYTYLGLNTPVTVTYPEASIQYNLAIAASSTNLYAGLDNFGRVIDCRWQNIAGTPFDVARLKYGYDQASNRLWRQDVVAQSYSQNFDELYTNDGLYRLQTMQRGQFTSTPPAGFTNINFQQDWTLDPTGNWHGFIEEAGGTSVTLNQTRTANTVNEITGITNSIGSAWAQPHYDAAGNMTTIPQPNAPGSQYTGTFDAWQRMTQLLDPATSQIVQQNQYDGRNFRIAKLTYTGGTLSETRQFYHTASWQVLEERISGTTPDRQYVWGLRYIDDLVLRDRSVSGTLDERLYALQDANWNMVALFNPGTSAIVERFAYSPYGVVLPLNPGFTPFTAGVDYDWTILYTGQVSDSATGFYCYRGRFYSSEIGTFVTWDPLGTEGGVNFLAYVENRPLVFTDPFGYSIYINPIHNSVDDNGDNPSVNARRTLAFIKSVTAALAELCPCLRIETQLCNDGTYRVAALPYISTDPFSGFCDCLKKHTAGCTLLHDLLTQTLPNNYLTIFYTGNENGGWTPGTSQRGAGITWKPGFRGAIEASSSTDTIVLGHELGHAWSGMLMPNANGVGWTWRIPPSQQGSIFRNGLASQRETIGVQAENQVGAELVNNYSPRTTYIVRGRTYNVPKPTNRLFGDCDCVKYEAELKKPGGWQ